MEMHAAMIFSWCYPRIVNLPCPKGADRRGAVCKTKALMSPSLLALRISIKRTFNRHTNAIRISVAATCFPPSGNAVKLSGRTFLAPHRGSCPKG